MSTVGLFFIDIGQLHALERERRQQRCRAIGGAMAICLFSYLGVGDRRRSPRPRCATPTATSRSPPFYGTLATAVVYMLSLTAVFGILPGEVLSESTAPFSDACD